MKKICFLCVALIISFFSYSQNIFQNFDSLPVTGTSEIPGDGGGWRYSSHITNTGYDFYGSCGYWNTAAYTANNKVHDYFNLYKNTYNSTHMGFEAYQFLEIDNQNVIHGNSMRIMITGGKTDKGAGVESHGLSLFCKEEYLAYLTNSQDPVDTTTIVGCPDVYISNNSKSIGSVQYVFPSAAGANRLSLYMYLPDGLKNDVTGTERQERMVTVGPYSDQPNSDVYPPGHNRYDTSATITGHWYHDVMVEGGAWIHISIDAHPVHSNTFSDATYYPYPSRGIRDMGVNYFNRMYKSYFSAYPYEGIGKPPYYVWMDEMEFQYDAEPQNEETIGTVSIGYWPDAKEFQISFCDKYLSAYAYATYEIRYSFSPITNANWNSATLADITDDPRWNDVSSSGPGRIQKHTQYYKRVWGKFKLQSQDEANLVSGTKVYFAVKDVSQNPLDLSDPIGSKQGRNYRNQDTLYDFAKDSAALGLIKRIDYYISSPYITNNKENTTDDKVGEVKIFPNPARNIIRIEPADHSAMEIDYVIIYDLTGNQLLNKKNVDNKIDISCLPDGIFILELFTGNTVIHEKLTIIR